MLYLEEGEETKKKPERKKGSSLIEMNLENGIQKLKGLNFGAITMEQNRKVSIFEFSL
jgi:hypothetical protein